MYTELIGERDICGDSVFKFFCAFEGLGPKLQAKSCFSCVFLIFTQKMSVYLYGILA